MSFTGLENLNLPDLSPFSFGTTPELIAKGKLSLVWLFVSLAEEGVSIEDDETIFSVCFEVTGESGTFAPVSFSQEPTFTELIGWPGPTTFKKFVTISGGVFIGDFPDATPLELLSSCSSGGPCDSITDYNAQIGGGKPPYAFEWRLGDSLFSTSPNVRLVGANLYHLKVTDADGQVLLVSISAGKQLLNIAAEVQPDLCHENTGAIKVLVSGGSGSYGYQWSDGSTDPSRTGLAASLYELTVTDLGVDCTGISRFEVERESCDPAAAALSLPFSTVRPNESVCVDFKGEQFQGVRKMEMDLEWDAGVARLSTVSGGKDAAFGIDNWIVNHDEEGVLNLQWENQDSAVYFFRSRQLLSICFMGESVGTTALSWGSGYIFESDDALLDPMFSDGRIEVSEAVQEKELALDIPDLTVAEGEVICVPVYAFAFDSILGFQYTHHWDSTVLRLDGVLIGDLPNLSARNFGPGLDQDFLAVSWTSGDGINGITLPDSTVLYALCFTAVGSDGEQSSLWVDGKPVPVEVVVPFDQLTGLKVRPGSVTISRDYVWPGDTDHNGIANHLDLLNIGLAYGETGPARSGENPHEWAPMEAADWERRTPKTLLDYKHIDADGNGQITVADTSLIIQNWGRITTWYDAPEDDGIVRFEPAQGAPLFIAAREEVKPGKNTFDVILGTEQDPAEEVYGLAFSIYYQYEGIKSEQVYAGFDPSWLGMVDDNLLAIQRNFPEDNRIDIAITRIDGQNISGRGAIASLHVTIEDIILFDADDGLIYFSIDHVKAIDFAEEERPMTPEARSMIITGQTTPTDDVLHESSVDIFPNPAADHLVIQSEGVVPERLIIMSPLGIVIRQQPYQRTLLLEGLQAGAYFLKIEAKGQSIVKSFVVY